MTQKLSVSNNSPSRNSSHPDDHFQSRYVTPGFRPFSYKEECLFPRGQPRVRWKGNGVCMV